MRSTINKKSILLYEPQCWGFEHAVCNAALIHTVRLAYPSVRIVFYGEQTHLRHVQDQLDRTHGVDRIDFRPIGIPDRKSSNWRRLPLELSRCNQILFEASHADAKALLLCSITNTTLLAIKILIGYRHLNLPTVVIPHGCLSSITGGQTRRPWNWIIGLRRVLALPHPPNLRLVALGDSILNAVKKVQPNCESQWSELPLAYLWSSDTQGMCDELRSTVRPLCFGFLGAGNKNKGLDAFCRLADDVAPSQEIARFTMAGFYSGPAEEKPASLWISAIPDQPLPQEEFETLVHQTTYVVSTAKPDHYSLTASATFLDALAFLKPGIYLRNDYIEYYFERMGDIGYLCNSYDEMVETIRGIISNFPSIRYQRQVENIRKGRVIFEPETLAPRLRSIVESCVV